MGCWTRSWATLRREFKLSNFKLDHPEPQLFLASEWQSQPVSEVKVWYVVYRWVWALYHVSWWAANLAFEGNLDATIQRKAYHFIYLTNWAYLSIAIMNVVHACIMTSSWLRYRRTVQLPKTTTTQLKVLWVLQNIVFPPALLICSLLECHIQPSIPITALNLPLL
ncbi:protein rolling stone-like [Homarus americanus]|uniref:protein rolling stone-like n=1 Tax=Homarus americanus TaxID=6706 RepID=UPI001C496DBD|nr:protein rolling stone-like [Homarus americanus]